MYNFVRSLTVSIVGFVSIGLGAQQTPGRPGGTVGFAIVVGVSEYSEATGLAALRFAAKDANDMADALTGKGYVVRRMLNGDATRSLVLKALRDLSATVTERDQVLFYFSGHGFQDNNDHNLLATYGVTAEGIGIDGLSLDDVLGTLDSMKAKSTAALVDACRSQATRDKSAGPLPFRDLPKGVKTAVLYSTSPKEASFEDERQSQGVFTRYLLEGLKGKARNDAGVVTFNGLAGYVQSSMRTSAFASGKRQTPTYSATGSGGNLVLAGATTVQEPTLEPREVSVPIGNYIASRRVDFGSGRFVIAYDPGYWQLAGEPASDRAEFTLNQSRLSAALTHDNVQTNYQRLVQQAVENLGGAGLVRVVDEGRVTQSSTGFYRALLAKGTTQYAYYYYSGELGTVSAVVYGPTNDPAWASGLAERLLRDLAPRR